MSSLLGTIIKTSKFINCIFYLKGKDDDEKMDVELPTSPKKENSTDEDTKLDESTIIEAILGEIISKIEDNSPKETSRKSPSPAKTITKAIKKEEKCEDAEKESSKIEVKDPILLPPPPPPPAPPLAAAPTFTSNYFSSGNGVPMIMWPKDRVMITRLENIIQMFENKGEWPVQQRNLLINPQMSATSMLPLSNSFSISNLVGNSGNSNSHMSLLNEQRKLMMSPMLLEAHTNHSSMDGLDQQQSDMYDYNENSQNDSEFSQPSKYGKPKRGRPSRGTMGDVMNSGGGGGNGRQMLGLRNKSGQNMADLDDYSDQDHDDYDDYMNEQQVNY